MSLDRLGLLLGRVDIGLIAASLQRPTPAMTNGATPKPIGISDNTSSRMSLR